MYNFTPMLFPEVINFTLLVYMLGLHGWKALKYNILHACSVLESCHLFGTQSFCTCGINIYMPGNDE